MALDVILACLVGTSALNLLLICDLYGRSARLALFTSQVHQINVSMAHSLKSLQAKLGAQ
jgi:hypothetical protein